MRIASVLAGVLVAGTAQAATINLTAVLDGLQEVPANASPATGSATIVVDDVANSVTITGSYSGLLGTAPFGHLHGLAPVGANAGVLFGLTVAGAPNGTFSGNAVLTPAEIAGVIGGQTYINIHTPGQFQGGEIRGQVVPEPGTISLLAGAGLLALRRRRA